MTSATLNCPATRSFSSDRHRLEAWQPEGPRRSVAWRFGWETSTYRPVEHELRISLADETTCELVWSWSSLGLDANLAHAVRLRVPSSRDGVRLALRSRIERKATSQRRPGLMPRPTGP